MRGASKASDEKISGIGAWALAVGGMIGGGIYTLAGVILGFAGPLAWVSLLLGCLLALATSRSYTRLSVKTGQEGVPVSYLLKKGRRVLAGVLAWWLVLIYVLAIAVYAFTFGEYIGRALGASPIAIHLAIAGVLFLFVLINLLGIRQPTAVQIAAVVIELLVLLWLAVTGILRWNPVHLSAGVPRGSLGGVISGAAATFIAFEGFEMLAYDLRELKNPKQTLTRALPWAIVAVGVAYAIVTVGAASLVGASMLVAQKENALAVAGSTAAGEAGLVIVTITACASAASAVNATLFSVSRLTRTSAESRLLPRFCARTNRHQCPYWSVFLIAAAGCVVAVFSSLEPLVQVASLAFLLLFWLINLLACIETRGRSPVAIFGMLASAGAAIVVTGSLIATA